jgi:hypothetical protein
LPLRRLRRTTTNRHRRSSHCKSCNGTTISPMTTTTRRNLRRRLPRSLTPWLLPAVSPHPDEYLLRHLRTLSDVSGPCVSLPSASPPRRKVPSALLDPAPLRSLPTSSFAFDRASIPVSRPFPFRTGPSSRLPTAALDPSCPDPVIHVIQKDPRPARTH